MAAKKKAPTKTMPIDAGTGRIVKPGYAKKHPDTTVNLTVPAKGPAKKKPSK